MKQVTAGQFFMTIRDEKVTYVECAGLCREYSRTRDEADTRVKGGFGTHEDWSCARSCCDQPLETLQRGNQILTPCRMIDLNLGL